MTAIGHILTFFLLLPILHTYISLSVTVMHSLHYHFELIKFLMCMMIRFGLLCISFAMADAIVSLPSITNSSQYKES